MKKTLFTLGLSFFGLTAIAQRDMDLAVETISPNSDTTVQQYGQFTYSIKVKNIGSEDFTTNDTLQFYQIADGDTVFIEMLAENHINVTGISIPAGNEYIHSMNFMLVTSDGEEDMQYHCWFVKPVNGNDPINETDLSNNKDCRMFTIAASPTNSIEGALNKEISIYPNPAKDFIYINGTINDEVTISSIDGKTVESFNLKNNQFDISRLENGIYLVRYQMNNDVFSTRITISK